MSDGVWVAIIGGQSAVIVALITVGLPLLASARKHARTASEQVTNSHPTNLRDDLDEKHGENLGRIGRLEKGQVTLRRDVTGLMRGQQKIAEHLGIEDTLQPGRKK